MINKQFEAYKIRREIKRSGDTYKFQRHIENEFGEPIIGIIGMDDDVCNIQGLYHEENSNVQITTGDTTQVRTKKIPMVLCEWEKVADKLLVGDFTIINRKVFKVTGVVNIQEWSIVADISLEVVDNGIQN